MASYYNQFSKVETQQEATFTVPYYDLFGLGKIPCCNNVISYGQYFNI